MLELAIRKKYLVQLVSPVPPANASPAEQIRHAKWESKRFLTTYINPWQFFPNKTAGWCHVA